MFCAGQKQRRNEVKMEKRKRIFRRIWKNKTIYIVLLPALVWYLIFVYVPMGGLMLAFKDYKANLGILGSPWTGLKHFENLFRDVDFWQSVGRTLKINVIRLFVTFPVPVIIALLFNELRIRKYKKVLQTVFTFPHFLSWIIIASVLRNVLAYDGIVNSIISLCGGDVFGEQEDVPAHAVPDGYLEGGGLGKYYLSGGNIGNRPRAV